MEINIIQKNKFMNLSIHNLIDLFFSSWIIRKLMNRNKCPKGLKEIKIAGKGYIRYKDWGDFWEYREIWIEPKEREKGWGTILMNELCDLALRHGISEIRTIVHTDGKSDILGKFISSNGFIPTNEKEGFNFKKIVK